LPTRERGVAEKRMRAPNGTPDHQTVGPQPLFHDSRAHVYGLKADGMISTIMHKTDAPAESGGVVPWREGT
jgi:hypothetical protein